MWTNNLQGLRHTAGANNLLVIHTPHEWSSSLIHLCNTKQDKQTCSRSASTLPEHLNQLAVINHTVVPVLGHVSVHPCADWNLPFGRSLFMIACN